VPPVLYYHPDHLGSTQYVTDADQALSQHAEYLPSGELWADQTDSRFQNRQPYLFNGKELDLSTGLYHYGARSYEPRLGVWLSPDPVLADYMIGKINGGGVPADQPGAVYVHLEQSRSSHRPEREVESFPWVGENRRHGRGGGIGRADAGRRADRRGRDCCRSRNLWRISTL
jgi:RHS repeat-associated protein